jgi:hypothetical protein
VTFRSYYEKSPNVLAIWRAFWGERFLVTLALMWDSFVQILVDAARSSWLAEDDGPAYDALRPLGQDRSIQQFPGEDWLQYRDRLRNAWNTWSRAGSFSIIVEQLALAGFPGATITRTGLTEFTVHFPVGTHSFTAAPAWGSFAWGDGTAYGPGNMTPEQAATIRGIIKQWKAHNWICRRVTFQLTGWAYGDGHSWGDPGLVWGGSQTEIGVY